MLLWIEVRISVQFWLLCRKSLGLLSQTDPWVDFQVGINLLEGHEAILLIWDALLPRCALTNGVALRRHRDFHPLRTRLLGSSHNLTWFRLKLLLPRLVDNLDEVVVLFLESLKILSGCFLEFRMLYLAQIFPPLPDYLHDIELLGAFEALGHLRPHFLDKQHVRSQGLLWDGNFCTLARGKLFQLWIKSSLVLLCQFLVL